MNGFVIAAPHSGSGKTVFTLGLLRALRQRGADVSPAKAGPDYIDPAFHKAASGGDCINLDPWAMRPALLSALAHQHAGEGTLIVEAMMGLYDGAADGSASAADLAVHLGLPVVLVIDASKMAHSIAAIATGYRNFRADLQIAGVVLNRVGSPRHEAMLREALNAHSIDVLGVLPDARDLVLPSRHLGLVQAQEHVELERFCDIAAELVTKGVDIGSLTELRNVVVSEQRPCAPLPSLGQRMAVARDAAFAFSYPHLLSGWRQAGVEISFFSPLADEAPQNDVDAVFLPGGYPELHAGTLAGTTSFLGGLRKAADQGTVIYGECGGYMVLGEALTDAEGTSHAMAGLLPLVTSFEKRKRHLGYRQLAPLGGSPWPMDLRGHEFHYSTVMHEGDGDPLFAAQDALGNALGSVGQRVGSVAGSYMHVIDRADQ